MIVSLRRECAPLERTMAGSERGPRSVSRRDQRRETAVLPYDAMRALTTRRSGSLGDRAAGYRKAKAAALLPSSQALPLRAARAASASGRPTGDERKACHARWARVDGMVAGAGKGTSP